MARRLAAIAFALLLIAGYVIAAGTVTTTEISSTSVKKVTFAWTSSAGGAADATTTKAYDGRVIGLTTIPSGGAAPDDNYDVTVKDVDGHDVLLGRGIDRDTANTEFVTEANMAGVAGSTLTLAVTNAGAAKQGTVILWVR